MVNLSAEKKPRDSQSGLRPMRPTTMSLLAHMMRSMAHTKLTISPTPSLITSMMMLMMLHLSPITIIAYFTQFLITINYLMKASTTRLVSLKKIVL